jgi:hypothetical protein
MGLSGIVALGLVLILVAIAYLLVVMFAQRHIVDGHGDPLNEPPWWPPEIAPPAPGPYETRVTRSHILQTKDTIWTGEKWVYMNNGFGCECYYQNLEWRALTA